MRRIDALLAKLENAPDAAAREPARELIEIVLDLHALALARIMAAAAGCDDRRLLSSLAEDAQIKAVLVLHGLHPEEIDVRVRKAVDHLRAHLGAQGIRVEFVEINAATVRLRMHCRAQDMPAARREIEQALTDAAPDLEQIIIEALEDAAPTQTPALAG